MAAGGSLFMLLVFGAAYCTGFASPYWYVDNWGGRYNSGLWMVCSNDGCYRITGSTQDYFTATRGLTSAGVALLAIACISHLVWTCSTIHRTANIARKVTMACLLIGALVGSAGVILFGVKEYLYIKDKAGQSFLKLAGWSYWVTAGGAAGLLLLGTMLPCCTAPQQLESRDRDYVMTPQQQQQQQQQQSQHQDHRAEQTTTQHTTNQPQIFNTFTLPPVGQHYGLNYSSPAPPAYNPPPSHYNLAPSAPAFTY